MICQYYSLIKICKNTLILMGISKVAEYFWHMTVDLVNYNAYPNFGQSPSIFYKDIEWKRNSDKNDRPSRDITMLQIDEH